MFPDASGQVSPGGLRWDETSTAWAGGRQQWCSHRAGNLGPAVVVVD